MGYRPEAMVKFMAFHKYKTVLDVAMALHENNTGSSESLDEPMLLRHRQLIQEVLDSWNYEDSCPFDKCVKDLLHAVLEEKHWRLK